MYIATTSYFLKELQLHTYLMYVYITLDENGVIFVKIRPGGYLKHLRVKRLWNELLS